VNVGTFPARRAALSPGALAVVDGDRRVTFAEFAMRCDRTARALRDLGVVRGDRVGVLLPNSLEWLETFFGAGLLGAVVVPLNWRLSPDELSAICEHAGVTHLIYAPALPPADRLAQRGGFRHCVPIVAATTATVAGGVPADARAGPVEAWGSDDAPLLIIYTSGTTGRPKGAVHTHRTWYWAAATVGASADIRPGDRALVVAPMYHVGGLVMSTLHAQLGVATVCLPAFDPAAVIRVIREEGIAHFLCVPTMLNMIRQHEVFDTADFSSVRWCYSVGAPTPPALIRDFHARGLRVQLAYGLTETGGPATVVPPDAILSKPGSVGVPFFHTDIRVAGADGATAPPGLPGEVLVRAPHVIAGYWRNPEASADAIQDGWLHTGDIGRLDEDGFLHLVDRKHDMIISGGENVYPTEIERTLAEHADVADAVVLGIPDERWGEIVCAAVQPRPGRALTVDVLVAYCRTRLAGYKIPRRIVFVDAIPRTATGKVLRRELRHHLEDRHA
jgi:acyl-CoA synthetase (AMP-forming)/AMP-acid ligase II